MREREKASYAVEVHATDESEVGGGTLIVSVQPSPGGDSSVRLSAIDDWNFEASAMSIGTAATLAQAVSGAVAAAVRHRQDGTAFKDATGTEVYTDHKKRPYSAIVYADDGEMEADNVSISASHPPAGESCVYVEQHAGWDFDTREMTVETAAAFAEALNGAVAASLGKRPQPPFEPPEES